MNPRLLARASLFLLSCLLAGAATADWVAESDAHTTLVLETQARFAPEAFSGLGLEDFDEDIMDLRPGLAERSEAALQGLRETLEERRRVAEHPKVIQDLDILIQSLDDTLAANDLQRRHMLPYYNVPQSLFFGFRALLDPRTDPERYPAALERLAKYNAEPSITELARARTAERFEVPGLTGPFQGEVQRDLDNLPRYLAGMRQLFADAELEGWEDAFAELEAQLTDYAAWVREEILPRARADHRLPEEIYANALVNYGVRATPDELIERAQFGFQEIRAQMKALARRIAAERGWENGELLPVIRRLKQNQLGPDQVLEVYRERLAAIEDIIREHDIITLPERAASIRLATEAESAAIPAPFMSPPQLIGNTGQYGEFVLVQKNPAMAEADAQMDDWTHEAMTWALTVHEARPGHELQFASLVENGTSLARAIYAFNSANVEGWGLYSEAIMQEYLPLEGQLFTLQARLQRAARMFLDPMVNLGRLSVEDAVAFMREQVGLSEAMARSEADRYAFLAPGQATSYYYGYIALQRLRTEVEMALGEAFDERAYHDFLLAQGLLPPDLLRAAVLEEFVPAQRPVAGEAG